MALSFTITFLPSKPVEIPIGSELVKVQRTENNNPCLIGLAEAGEILWLRKSTASIT